MTVTIKELTPNALSEAAGTKLREKILEKAAEEKSERIVLDFSGITLYATMFFNASIGYLVLNRKDVISRLDLVGLSSLGDKTYKHSLANAKEILEQNLQNSSVIDQTISDNLN